MDSGLVASNGKGRARASAQKQRRKRGLLRVKEVAKVSETCGYARQRCAGRTGKAENCKEKLLVPKKE